MEFTTRPELKGSFGMVSSTHWLASQVGMRMLERDGNAFDAAAAAGFTLQVVEPHQNGPGGDLPVIFARSGDPKPIVMCAQGPAPARATIEYFEELGLREVPGTGLLPAPVPGAVLGWLTLLRDHGTFSLAEVLAPACEYAESGFPVTEVISDYVGRMEKTFREHWPTNAETYLQDGTVPKPGDRLSNIALANTYKRLIRAETEALESGARREEAIEEVITEWSEGFVAEAIHNFCGTSWRDSSGEVHSGLLTRDDLKRWRPTYEDPVTIDFDGYTVCKPGFWSQGPVLLQQLKLLEPFSLDLSDAQSLHTIIEISKLAFADRDAWFGDVEDLPFEELLSEEYLDKRRRLISDKASLALRPGCLSGREPVLPTFEIGEHFDRSDLSGIGEPNAVAAMLDSGPSPDGEARSDTVHVDVVDKWGNVVAAMPSGGWLHSSPVIPELGFPLGTRLQMAWLERDLPNSLKPGKRPRTTLSPTLVLKGGEAIIGCGSPGGDQQDQWQLQLLLRTLREGRQLQEAIEQPAFHSTHSPSSFYPHESQPGGVVMESRFDAETIEQLRRLGHRINLTGAWEIGRLCAVRREPESGRLSAGANPRGMQGYAVGR